MRKLIFLSLFASGLQLAAQSASTAAVPAATSAPAPVALSAPSSPAAIFTQAPSSAANASPAETPLDPTLNERRAVHVDLIMDATHNFSVDLPASPIIHDDEINMIPGEEFLVEVEMEKGRLTHLRRVTIEAHPERTLHLKFSQSTDRSDPGMTFTISNPFKQFLKYRSMMMPAGRTRFQETSNVGVGPEIMSFEFWPNPILRLLLSDFELVAPDAPRDTPGEKK